MSSQDIQKIPNAQSGYGNMDSSDDDYDWELHRAKRRLLDNPGIGALALLVARQYVSLNSMALLLHENACCC